MEHLERALELDPEHSAARGLLIDCDLLRGDEEQALAHLLEVLPPQVASAIRDAFQASGWEGVTRRFLDLVENPTGRARALIELGRFDEGWQCFGPDTKKGTLA